MRIDIMDNGMIRTYKNVTSVSMMNDSNEMVSANTGVPKSLLEEKDNINPDHYKSSTSLECIEAMDIVFGNIFVTNFCIGNAWKYIWRWKHKNGLEDLEKAKWYAEKAKHDILHGSCDHREKDKLLMIVNRILDYIEVNNCPEQDGDK